MRTVYTCPECGSPAIQRHVWVDVNHPTWRPRRIPLSGTYCCPDCESDFDYPVEIEEDDVEGVVHSTDCMLGLDCTCGVASD